MSNDDPASTPVLNYQDKNSSFFATDHLTSGLRGRAARAGAVTATSQGVKFAINLAVTLGLARLLTPRDYGLIAMVVAFTGFITLFKDMGLSAATIQKEDITHEQVSTLFWVNIALSAMVSAAIVALAPVIAWFYDDPRLTLITAAFALGPLFSGVGIQHQALLRRQMRFSVIAVAEVTSLVVGAGTALVMAWYGARYWALVAQTLLTALTFSTIVWIACGWRPGKPALGTGVRPMLKFGGHLTGFNLINYWARNLDNVLIGRRWGDAELGLYAKAYSLFLLPIAQVNAPLTMVVMPVLSRLVGEPGRFRRVYLHYLALGAGITMPGIVFAIVLSPQLFPLLLGGQWTGAVPIFQILGIAGLVQVITNTGGVLMISTGRTDRMLRLAVLVHIGTIASFFAGLPFHALGVAMSYTAFSIIQAVPNLWYTTKVTPVRLSDIAAALWRPATVAAAVGLATLGVKLLLPAGLRNGIVVLICTAVAAVVWLILSLSLGRESSPFYLLRDLRAGKVEGDKSVA